MGNVTYVALNRPTPYYRLAEIYINGHYFGDLYPCLPGGSINDPYVGLTFIPKPLAKPVTIGFFRGDTEQVIQAIADMYPPF